MKRVKVAVIDTGVDIYDDKIQDYIKYENELQIYDDGSDYKSINDIHGHGTMCIKTILSICNDVQVYPIKIFNDGRTNSINLVEALENLKESDIKLINISASTTNTIYENELAEICNRLSNNGKIIICSHHNLKDPGSSIPTIFKSVIGVQGYEKIYKDKDFIYDRFRDIQMYANSKEIFTKFRGEVTHFGKNSRAAAVVSGIVAKILTENNHATFSEIEEILIKNSCKSIQIPTIKKYDTDKNKLNIAEKLVGIINESFSNQPIDLNFIEKYSSFNNFTNIDRHNAYDYLVKINEEFNIDINYRDILLYELEDIDYIVDRIYREL